MVLENFGKPMKDGWRLARQEFNDEEEYELPKEIGSLIFYVSDWGPLEGGGLYDRSEFLETH